MAAPLLDAAPLPSRRKRLSAAADARSGALCTLSLRERAGVRGMPEPSLSLLSRLWLSEPDAALLREAVAAGFPQASIEDLALAYADLFLLNVYPYGSVYLDSSGELNGAPAAWAEQQYAAAGYSSPDLSR